MKRIEPLLVALAAIVIILALDLLTNSVDTVHNRWDFLYYIAMAKDGFNAQPMASPLAYRYVTPGIVHLLTLMGFSIEQGFQGIAYFGAFTQLTGIFFFTKWATNSTRGAWIAMFVTALSIFNLKFLLFDIYRPDHLAYGLILLQTYFAFERKFLPLVLLTLVASQIREFNVVPLAAYLIMIARDKETERATLFKQGFVSALFILPAILLPRLLIPVTEDYQLIGLSLEGLLTAIALPFYPGVTVNFIFSMVAYLLPLAFVASLRDLKTAFQNLPVERRTYLLAYTILVGLLSLFGGTDMYRFATFLFLPQIILIGLLADGLTNVKITSMFICLFVFNRIWAHFPDWDKEAYQDFYGGHVPRLNFKTLQRILELSAFFIIGNLLQKFKSREVQ